MSDDDQQADFLNGLTLGPDWAKQSSAHHASELNHHASRGDWDSADTRRGKGGPRRDRNRDDARGRRDERRQPPRDRTERPRFAGAGGRAPGAPDRPRQQQQEEEGRQGTHPTSDFRPPRRDHQPPPPPPFEIRFLPNQKALSVIARKVQGSHRAIPLRDLVRLFFENPDSVEVRLAFDADHKDGRFYQCARCGWFSRDEHALRGHLLTAHFQDYFDSETITVDPPTGNFTGVARCGITGRLLAPPNHHSYNKMIQQMLRTACAGCSEEAYRARIQMDNTPEAIEQWREEASRQEVYFPKPDPAAAKTGAPRDSTKKTEADSGESVASEPATGGGPEPLTAETASGDAVPEGPSAPDAVSSGTDHPTAGQEPVRRMTIEEAEDLYSRTQMPKLMKSGRQVTVTHAVSKTIDDKDVLDAIARAWDREQIIQAASLFFAVRGGLRSRKLALFRASDSHREEFVIHKAPLPLDPTHAVTELKLIVDYIAQHPGCTRTGMLADLIPADASPDQADGILKQVAFITERGHVIEYYNGVLALAAEHPHYGTPLEHTPAAKPARKHPKPAPLPASGSKNETPVEPPSSGGEERAALKSDPAVSSVTPAAPAAPDVPAPDPGSAPDTEQPANAEPSVAPAASDPVPAPDTEKPAEDPVPPVEAESGQEAAVDETPSEPLKEKADDPGPTAGF